jgi:hypothetical protein
LNPFDIALKSQVETGLGVFGIGSAIRSAGRSIDSARRSIGREIEGAVKSVNHERLRNVAKVKAELKRFIASDLFKIVVVIVVAVAIVYGFGPQVIEGLKSVMAKAGGAIKATLKEGARYFIDVGYKEMITLEVKKKALDIATEKVTKEYIKHEIRGFERQAKIEEQAAIEEQTILEDKVYKELEAQFLKETGYTATDVQNQQIESSFVYNKRKPTLGDFWRGGGIRERGEAQLKSAIAVWQKGYDVAFAAYAKTKNMVPAVTMTNALKGIDKMARQMASVENEHDFKDVVNGLKNQGLTDNEINAIWRKSKTFATVTRNALVESFAPLLATDYIKAGVNPALASDVAIVETARIADNALSEGEFNPLLLIGAIGAALFLI